MHYSRRNFLKAAGAGIALTAVEGESLFAAIAPPLPTPITKERGTFIINGKPLAAEYEARTTLWEEHEENLSLPANDDRGSATSVGIAVLISVAQGVHDEIHSHAERVSGEFVGITGIVGPLVSITEIGVVIDDDH